MTVQERKWLASADVDEARKAIARTAKLIADYQRDYHGLSLGPIAGDLLQYRAADLEAAAAKIRKAAAILRE